MAYEPSESSEEDSEDNSNPKSSVVVCGGGLFDSVCLFPSWGIESSDSSSLSDDVDDDELESWFESDSEKTTFSQKGENSELVKSSPRY